MAQLKPTAMPDLKVRKQITAAALVNEIELPENMWAWSATLAPDERRLLVGGNGAITVVDLIEGSLQRHEIEATRGDSISQMKFTPDHERIVVTGWNGTVSVLAWPSLTTIVSYPIANDRLHACAVLPDGKSAWVGGHDCKRTRVELATGKALAVQSGEWGWISDAALSPDGSTLITSDAATVIRFCDGATGRERSQLKLGIADNILVGATEALIPNLYTAIVSMPDGKVVTKFEGEHKLGASAAVYVGDEIVSVGKHDPLMVVWDRAAGRPLLTMKPLKKGAFASVLVVGDRLVTVPLYTGPIQMWRTAALVAAARSR